MKNVLIFGFLSYPFIFAVDRANFELIVFMCLYIFVFFYKKYPYVATIALSVAVALKAFPAIFAILFLFDKKYKFVLFAALFSILLTLVSYATLPGGLLVNMMSHIRNMGQYNLNYGLGNAGLMFGNSLFGAIKFLLIFFNPRLAENPAMISFLAEKAALYYLASLFFLICFLFYIYFIERQYWKVVAILVFSLNLLPLVSGDYKLLHIFIPFFLFVNDEINEKTDWFYVILFCLLLIPKNYYYLPGINEVNAAVLLNPLLMFLMIISIMVTGSRKYFKEHNVFSSKIVVSGQ